MTLWCVWLSMCDRKDNESMGDKRVMEKEHQHPADCTPSLFLIIQREHKSLSVRNQSREISSSSPPHLFSVYCTGVAQVAELERLWLNRRGERLMLSSLPGLGVPLWGEEKKVWEKQKKEEQRKPERLTNLRAKWDGNGKRDRAIGKGGREAAAIKRRRSWGGGVEENEMRPNFLWQSPCSCCRCWGHFTKAGPDANVISSWAPGEFATVPND